MERQGQRRGWCGAGALAWGLALTACRPGGGAAGTPEVAVEESRIVGAGAPDDAQGEARDRGDGLLAWLRERGPFDRVCAPRQPVCVLSPGGAPAADALRVLTVAADALALYTEALRAPAPRLGAPPVPIYLVPGAPPGGATVPGRRSALGGFDEGEAVVALDPRDTEGCDGALAVAHAVARATQVQRSPAAATALAEASAAALARWATPCMAALPGPFAEVQSAPEGPLFFATGDHDAPWPRGVPTPRHGSSARGGGLFFAWLDGRYGTSPGSLSVGPWALAPSRTPFGGERWREEPTLWHVLAFSFQMEPSHPERWEAVLAGFASARSLLGRDTPAAFVSLGPAAPLLRAEAAWSIPFPSAPRRLAGPRPVAPFGVALVEVSLAAMRPGASLRVEAEWEEHARFLWTAIKLGPDGAPRGEVRLTALRRGTTAGHTLAGLDGLGALLLVGTHLGDPARRFDAAEGPGEPHGYLLTLAPE